MNEPQPSKFEQTRQSFAKIIRHKTDMEEKIMKLLKHPDATGSQIMMARELLLGVEEPMRKVVTALREKYPYPTISVVTRPWHRQEYDKYETSVDKTRAHDSASEEDYATHEEGKTNGI